MRVSGLASRSSALSRVAEAVNELGYRANHTRLFCFVAARQHAVEALLRLKRFAHPCILRHDPQAAFAPIAMASRQQIVQIPQPGAPGENRPPQCARSRVSSPLAYMLDAVSAPVIDRDCLRSNGCWLRSRSS